MSARGWHRDPARHALAAKGVKTAQRDQRQVRWAQKIDVHEGALGGWSKDLPQKDRLAILHRLIKMQGYAAIIRRLNFLINVGSDPETDAAAKSDMSALQAYYGGKT
jgi:hypothetical protein